VSDLRVRTELAPYYRSIFAPNILSSFPAQHGTCITISSAQRALEMHMALSVKKLSPAIGAVVSGVDFSKPLDEATQDAIYAALIDHLVLFFPGSSISPGTHLEFARTFGEIDQPHPVYPHVEGFPNIVKLENDGNSPPDTDSWHADLTFRQHLPFSSILVARSVPQCGGDTLWSSSYAAYDRLPDGMKRDLEGLDGIHDIGDFRNTYAIAKDGESGEARLNAAVARLGHKLRPLIDHHPVTKRKFLTFNEAYVTHIASLTANESNALKVWLANHMNRPEDQVRWRWTAGDMAMWDNRVTMHYAVADYLPNYRCMNRVTVVHDRRAPSTPVAA
jgi:taurine dioxygenase